MNCLQGSQLESDYRIAPFLCPVFSQWSARGVKRKQPPHKQTPVMTVLNPNAAGIDVHSDMHTVCVPVESVDAAAPTKPGGLPAHSRIRGDD
jgi:hypothetical protein